MPQTIRHVQPGLKPISSAYNPMVLRCVHAVLPLILRFRTRPWLPAGITRVEAVNIQPLVDLYHQFQLGKIRLMLAFRHVEVDDPLGGLYLLSRLVPRAARQQQIALRYPLHVHFLYDRGMPLWGGTWLGWLLSRIGGVSIHRGKHPDRQGLRAAREVMTHGQMPLAIAPEGATNGHSEIVSPLEPGVAQLGFWCVEDLQTAGRPETVWILPIGLQYRYITPPWRNLNRLMSRLEADAGLSVQSLARVAPTDREVAYCRRLLRLGDHLLSKLEQFYARFYHRPLLGTRSPSSTSPDSPEQPLEMRLQALLDHSLRVAEEYFGISSQGTCHERCRRIEEAGWTYIYRADVTDRAALSPLDRGLADWIAEEGSLRMLHMRLVESVVAVTDTYVQEKPTVERFAEIALLMFDVMARIRGDKLPRRPRLGFRSVRFTIGDPISVSDRWSTYHANRRAARQAIAQLTEDLQRSLESMIS